jgi:hypothetical protein
MPMSSRKPISFNYLLVRMLPIYYLLLIRIVQVPCPKNELHRSVEIAAPETIRDVPYGFPSLLVAEIFLLTLLLS